MSSYTELNNEKERQKEISDLWNQFLVAQGEEQQEIIKRIARKKFQLKLIDLNELTQSQKLDLVQEALLSLALAEAESSLLASANSFMDTTMKIVFALGCALGIAGVAGATQVIPQFDITSEMFGHTWNYVDTIGGTVEGVAMSAGLNGYKRNIWRKNIERAYLPVSAAAISFMAVGTGLQIAAVAGIACVGLFGAISFAGCTWVALAKASADLHYARQKLDPEFLLADRLDKRSKVLTQLEKTTRELHDVYFNALDPVAQNQFKTEAPEEESAIAKIKRLGEFCNKKGHMVMTQKQKEKYLKAINKLQAERHGLIHQYVRVNKQTEVLLAKPDLIKQYGDNETCFKIVLRGQERTVDGAAKEAAEINLMGKAIVVEPIILYSPECYEALFEKQKAKVKSKKIAVAAWSFAAVGMTLIAFSIFTGPAAPVVAALGTAIASVGAVLRIAELINNKCDSRSKKQVSRVVKKNLIDTIDLISVSKDIKNDTERLKYRLAFEALSQSEKCQKLLTMLGFKDNSIIPKFEKDFYERLTAERRKSLYRRWKVRCLLNDILSNKIDDSILSQYFQCNKEVKYTDAQLTCLKKSVDGKERKYMIEAACHGVLRAQTLSFFNNRKESLTQPLILAEPSVSMRGGHTY